MLKFVIAALALTVCIVDSLPVGTENKFLGLSEAVPAFLNSDESVKMMDTLFDETASRWDAFEGELEKVMTDEMVSQEEYTELEAYFDNWDSLASFDNTEFQGLMDMAITENAEEVQ